MKRLVLFLLACTRTPEAKPTLEIMDGGTEVRASVRARTTDGPVTEIEGRKLLVFTVADASVPIVGSYEQSGPTLVFHAAFVVPGEHYRATLRTRDGDLTREITLPAGPIEPPPTALWMRPLANDIPQNHLRFYVRFTQPMKAGSLEGVTLTRDDTHAKVGLAFQKREIWSSDRLTLTLLFHPGRQKRDIGFADGIGPVLTVGVSYSIVLSGMQNDHGVPMAVDFTHHFRVTEADRKVPDVHRFSVRAPSRNTLDPAVVSFGEPLDPFVATETVKLANATTEIGDDDTTVKLVPKSPWQGGPFDIEIGAVEDFAGNTPARLFDHETNDRAQVTPTHLAFSPR